MAFDFKKEFKEYYMPKNKPEIVTVPKANYIAVRGKGNPNEEPLQMQLARSPQRSLHRPDLFPHTPAYDLFPCTVDIHAIVSTHVETVCLLSNRKADSHIKLSLDMDEYYDIIEKEQAEKK